MKSLNEIIAELESFATAHWQIHTFGHGDVWEISPQSDGIVYPILWMVPQTSTPTLNEVVDEFTVLCMDLVDSGERNETEVLSDTRQIILDVCAYYRQTHTNSYIIEFGGSIEPFTERDPERVSGHSLTIRIKQPHDYNLCAVPANAVPVPPIPSCEPATWILDNTLGTQLSTGTIGSGLSDTIVAPDATYTLENTDGTELSSGSIASGDSEVIVAPDVTVLRDGLAYDTAPSGTTIDVPSNCPAPPYPPEWEPNPDWPDFPTTLAPTDELFYAIYPVYEDGYNRLALSRGSGNDFTVDPGDGSVPFNTVAGTNVYEYDYSSVPATAVAEKIDGVLTGRMVKYVVVTFTPITTITTVDLYISNSIKAQNYIDIYASLPNCSTFNIGNATTSFSNWSLLERVRLISSAASLSFNGLTMCVALRVVDVPWTAITVGTGFLWMNSLGPVDEMPDIAIAGGGSLSNSAFENSLVKSYGDVDLSNYSSGTGTTLFRFAKFRTIGTVTYPSSKTGATGDFQGTTNCRSVINVAGCSNVTGIVNMFRETSAPMAIVDDASAVTSTANVALNSNLSEGLLLNGITVGFSFVGTNLTTTGASASFTALGTAAGAQNITVTGTPFGVALAALDAAAVAAAAIATGKGFTIVN